MAKLEFYCHEHGGSHLVVGIDSDAVPRAGEYVNIRKVTYQIDRVTWAVDHTDFERSASLRANIEMVKT